jgi:hypothetical protein
MNISRLKPFFPRFTNRGFVAQVGNLLRRRLAAGGALTPRMACGLPIRDTADCQSALL